MILYIIKSQPYPLFLEQKVQKKEGNLTKKQLNTPLIHASSTQW